MTVTNNSENYNEYGQLLTMLTIAKNTNNYKPYKHT